jgi:hypothetical protein
MNLMLPSLEWLMQAVEVLWTPQDENDTLSERELLCKYPLLRSLWTNLKNLSAEESDVTQAIWSSSIER